MHLVDVAGQYYSIDIVGLHSIFLSDERGNDVRRPIDVGPVWWLPADEASWRIAWKKDILVFSEGNTWTEKERTMHRLTDIFEYLPVSVLAWMAEVVPSPEQIDGIDIRQHFINLGLDEHGFLRKAPIPLRTFTVHASLPNGHFLVASHLFRQVDGEWLRVDPGEEAETCT